VTAGNASSIRSLLSISPHLCFSAYIVYCTNTRIIRFPCESYWEILKQKSFSVQLRKIIKEKVNTKTFDVKNPPNVKVKNHKIL